MFQFSQFEAGYIISQKDLETIVGYRQIEKPLQFDFFMADCYEVIKMALKDQPQLSVYPALDFKGFIILEAGNMTAEERTLYRQKRDHLLRVQAQQNMQRQDLLNTLE